MGWVLTHVGELTSKSRKNTLGHLRAHLQDVYSIATSLVCPVTQVSWNTQGQRLSVDLVYPSCTDMQHNSCKLVPLKCRLLINKHHPFWDCKDLFDQETTLLACVGHSTSKHLAPTTPSFGKAFAPSVVCPELKIIVKEHLSTSPHDLTPSAEKGRCTGQPGLSRRRAKQRRKTLQIYTWTLQTVVLVVIGWKHGHGGVPTTTLWVVLPPSNRLVFWSAITRSAHPSSGGPVDSCRWWPSQMWPSHGMW